MARHGTIPEMIYHRQLQISAEKVNLASSEVLEVNESEEDVDTADSYPDNVDVEVAEYDSSTDEEEEVEGGGSHIPELDRQSTFLLGTTTRFALQIRINRFPMQRYLYFSLSLTQSNVLKWSIDNLNSLKCAIN